MSDNIYINQEIKQEMCDLELDKANMTIEKEIDIEEHRWLLPKTEPAEVESYFCSLQSEIDQHLDVPTEEDPLGTCEDAENFSQFRDTEKQIKSEYEPAEESASIEETLLGNHSDVHTGEESYECHICNKTFTRYSALVIHLRTCNTRPVQLNSVAFLQRTKFRLLSCEDKIKIKELGRPMPDINIEIASSSRNKTYKRQFNKNIYYNSKWICGCDEKNKLFCFPCVLFGGDRSWTVSGVNDLAHLTQSIKRHEETKRHLSNVLSLALLGNVNVQEQLDPNYWINMHKHNEQVDKNRNVLSRIIDCIKICGTYELALREHNEDDSSQNSGVIHGLIKFSAIFDNTLRDHLDSPSVFKGTSTDIQNELLECMLEVCRENITAEINDSNYLSLIVETNDVTSKFQMAVVLRYVNNGNPVERFWGFINPIKHNADSLATCIQSIIESLLSKNPNKLIAQAYDGAVISGKDTSVQLIKKKYLLAHFVHCYAHQLNLIITQAVSQNTQLRLFFSKVDDIVSFFSNSPQRINILNEVVRRRLPRADETNWNFKGRAVNVIYENRSSLIECVQKIQEQVSISEIINQASAIEHFLDDEIFLFWLNIFHHIMPNVVILYDQLQKRGEDATHIKNAIGTFEASINNIRENIDEIIQDLLSNDLEPVSKRSRISNENLQASAQEVCNIVIQCVKDRFESVGYVEIDLLFCSELFDKFSKNFPDQILDIVVTLYPNMFEIERLKTELSIIYARPDFKNFKGALAFLNFLKINNLEESFKETTKILELIITIPMTTVEAERCFITLDRIKNFLRNSVGENSENRLSALAMLSIENIMVKDINFNNKVIEKFAHAKQKRVELIYKK